MWMLHAIVAHRVEHAHRPSIRLNLCQVHFSLGKYNCLHDVFEHFEGRECYQLRFLFAEIADLLVVCRRMKKK